MKELYVLSPAFPPSHSVCIVKGAFLISCFRLSSEISHSVFPVTHKYSCWLERAWLGFLFFFFLQVGSSGDEYWLPLCVPAVALVPDGSTHTHVQRVWILCSWVKKIPFDGGVGYSHLKWAFAKQRFSFVAGVSFRHPPCPSLSECKEFGLRIQVWSLRDDLGRQQPAENGLRTKHWLFCWLKMFWFIFPKIKQAGN